jgi:hypothetical protein
MSDKASEAAAPAKEEAAFLERDDQETMLPYDKGGVPLYIAGLWVAFIVTYIVFMAVIALPDLRAWMGK